jgi:histone H1/5
MRVILLRDSHCLNAAINCSSDQVCHLKQGAVKREGAAIGKAELPQQGRTVHGPQTQGALRFTRSGFHTTQSRHHGVCKGRERGQGEHAALECRAPCICWRLRFAETFSPVGPRIGIRASPPSPTPPAVPRVGIGNSSRPALPSHERLQQEHMEIHPLMTDIIETTETEETPRAQAMAMAAAKKKAPAKRKPAAKKPAAKKAAAKKPAAKKAAAKKKPAAKKAAAKKPAAKKPAAKKAAAKKPAAKKAAAKKPAAKKAAAKKPAAKKVAAKRKPAAKKAAAKKPAAKKAGRKPAAKKAGRKPAAKKAAAPRRRKAAAPAPAPSETPAS